MRKDSTNFHILVIEDNLGDYFLIEEYFSEHFFHHQLVHVETFQAAKQKLSESENDWDAIFLDLSLPDHAGEKLIVDILHLAVGVPVIALTGFSDLDFSIKSLSLGISDYLLKDELNSAILYKTLIYAIERKKIVSRLQQSEKKYSDLFQVSPIAMWVFDRQSKKIVDVNHAAVNQYGYSKEEFLELEPLSLWENPDFNSLEIMLQDSRANKTLEEKSHVHFKKNGERIIVKIDSSPIFFNDIQGDLILVDDITEKTRYIETIENQNKTFHEIAWIQSHVVRAPLARLMGIVNLLETDHKMEPQEITEMLNFIKSSAFELDKIIREISQKSESIVNQNGSEPESPRINPD